MSESEAPSAVHADALPPIPRVRPAAPFAAADVDGAWSRPLRIFELVLSAPERVAVNLERSLAVPALALLFLAAAAVFALPYGFVLGLDAWWRIAALYLGSTLICLPSLYVFASYIGVRVGPAHIAVLALTIPAVAALFSFGFAPILGFLRATMGPAEGEVTWRQISQVLLVVALVAGVLQLWRCLLASRAAAQRGLLVAVLVVWHGVFAHVLLHMADVLALRG
jgi:hypothetical protein